MVARTCRLAYVSIGFPIEDQTSRGGLVTRMVNRKRNGPISEELYNLPQR